MRAPDAGVRLENFMEEQKKELENQTEEAAGTVQDVQEIEAQKTEDNEISKVEPGKKGFLTGLPSRTYTIWTIAGVYFIYTAYQLCKGKLDGNPESSWGFFAAGVGFGILALFLLFFGARGLMIREKEKKAGQEAAAGKQQEETVSDEEKPSQKVREGAKSMSIAERAKLASHLDDGEEESPDAFGDQKEQ